MRAGADRAPVRDDLPGGNTLVLARNPAGSASGANWPAVVSAPYGGDRASGGEWAGEGGAPPRPLAPTTWGPICSETYDAVDAVFPVLAYAEDGLVLEGAIMPVSREGLPYDTAERRPPLALRVGCGR